jgi:hypothetical protein
MNINAVTFFTCFSFFIKRFQEVAPVILKQPGSHWATMKPD